MDSKYIYLCRMDGQDSYLLFATDNQLKDYMDKLERQGNLSEDDQIFELGCELKFEKKLELTPVQSSKTKIGLKTTIDERHFNDERSNAGTYGAAKE